MKRFAPLLLILIVLHCVSAQERPEAYKFGEYDSIGSGCGEWARVADFLQKLTEQSDAQGLIVVYAGHGEERFGNVQAYVAELNKWIVWHQFPANRIDFVIAEGKKVFSEDYWIIPAGAEAPEFKPFEMDWADLQGKYYFSLGCPQCEPSYSFNGIQQNFEEYVNILQKFPGFKGEITVGSFADLIWVKNKLTKGLKLPRDRYILTLSKQKRTNLIPVCMSI
ncbi:MAG TPA: hypothetical protein VGO50_00070 [Pyrinomonadaceae bacterium]|jgi:hypothetical protein|nr:hypothetical protein [Pyrinomonadaceae bacterium]